MGSVSPKCAAEHCPFVRRRSYLCPLQLEPPLKVSANKEPHIANSLSLSLSHTHTHTHTHTLAFCNCTHTERASAAGGKGAKFEQDCTNNRHRQSLDLPPLPRMSHEELQKRLVGRSSLQRCNYALSLAREFRPTLSLRRKL